MAAASSCEQAAAGFRKAATGRCEQRRREAQALRGAVTIENGGEHRRYWNRRGPFIKNEPRPTPGLLRSVIRYLTLTFDFALSPAAAMAEGSAKAMTASALRL